MTKLNDFFARWFNPHWKTQGDAWGRLTAEAQGLDWGKVAELARQLPYEEHFLLTPYWKAASSKVQERDQWACSQCGREPGSQWLVVCRRDEVYGCTGSEHLRLDELVTLCKPCALRKSGQKALAIITDYEMMMDVDARNDPLQRIVQELKSGGSISIDKDFTLKKRSVSSD